MSEGKYLSPGQRSRILSELEEVIASSTFIEAGKAFLEIRNNQLYYDSEGPQQTFNQYCEERWGIHRMKASRLIGAAEVVDNLFSTGLKPLPINERQTRPLTRLPADQQVAAWKEVVAVARGNRITAQQVQAVVQQYIQKSAVLSSQSNEWFTPPEYLKLVRAVLGQIDLDPASSGAANRIVQASRFFTAREDGLSKKWKGRVFLNPPYGLDQNNRSNQSVWSKRLICDYEAGNVTEAILLVNASIGDAWFADLWKHCLCFANRRIRFIAPDGRRNQPTKGNVFAYFGTQGKAFVRHFMKIGHCVIPRGKYSEGRPSTKIANQKCRHGA